MHRFHRLAVGLTRTDTDAGLLRYAAMIARLGTATEVRFVHVLPTAEGSLAADADRVRDEMRSAVLSHFTDLGNAVQLAFDVLSAPLHDRLLAYTLSQKVDLLFLGHRRDHPGRWALARRMAMKAPCSVWMVPEGAPPTLNRILVPVDFSEHSADTLSVATSLAARVGHGDCLTLHVYFNAATATYEGYDRVIRGQEEEAFKKFLAPIDCRGVRVIPVFEEGANVAHVINRVVEAQNCDLVVMATRGRSRSATILLGSVTAETIRETRVPLLVVKHSGAQLGFLRALLEQTFHREGVKFD